MPIFKSQSAKILMSLIFGAFVLLLFSANSANSALKCELCDKNNYCTLGVIHPCPDTAPATALPGAKSELECTSCYNATTGNEPVFNGGDCTSCYQATREDATPKEIWDNGTCKTCAEVYGNSNQADTVKPAVYDDITGTCKSCSEAKGANTPYWNGTECVECGEGVSPHKIWDSTVGNKNCSCEDGYYKKDAIEIFTPEGKVAFGLSADMIFKPTAVDGNYWAGAMKQCNDQGKRLPNNTELAYLAQTIYGDTDILAGFANNLNVANEDLMNVVTGGNQSASLWSSDDMGDGSSTLRNFDQYSTNFGTGLHGTSTYSAFCISD